MNISTNHAAASHNLPKLEDWREAMRQDRVWGHRDMLLQTYAAIVGGFTEMAPDLAERGSAYAHLVNQQVKALEAGMIGLIQTMMLVHAEQEAQDS